MLRLHLRLPSLYTPNEDVGGEEGTLYCAKSNII